LSVRNLGPTGVTHAPPKKLSAETKEDIETLLCSKGFKGKDLSAFFAALDDAVRIYFAARQVDEESRPPRVRENVDAALEAAQKLVQKLESLDGNSKLLLDEIQSGTFQSIFGNAIETCNVLQQARTAAAQLPKKRPKMDYSKSQLALAVRHSIERHLGVRATSTKQSKKGAIFNDVLSAVMAFINQSRSGKPLDPAASPDVHKLTRWAVKGEICELQGGGLELIPASRLNRSK